MLEDTIQVLNPTLVRTPTYIWGSRRIDTIMASGETNDTLMSSPHLVPNEVTDSDHIAIVCDFNLKHVLNQREGMQMARRRLSFNRPKPISKYISSLKCMLNSHNVFDRMSDLITAITKTTLTQEICEEYNKIDEVITKSQIAAKKKCTKG